MRSVTIELDEWLADRVDELAKITRQSRTSFVITALVAEVTRLSGATIVHQPPAQPRASRKPKALSDQERKGFEAFWAEVPRKVSKGSAEVAWKRAIGRDSPEAIIKGARLWCEAMKDRETQFIKHPSSWLNAMGWLDEYEERNPQYLPVRSRGVEKTDAYRAELKAYKEKVLAERAQEGGENGGQNVRASR